MYFMKCKRIPQQGCALCCAFFPFLRSFGIKFQLHQSDIFLSNYKKNNEKINIFKYASLCQILMKQGITLFNFFILSCDLYG